ncbi:hypothetical protein EDB89DRAFT_1902958 [Lactarius sanguifluus]|nr:hypothetical protein EDB89DRAFT_1902958 [Lactarius sanguifluus]
MTRFFLVVMFNFVNPVIGNNYTVTSQHYLGALGGAAECGPFRELIRHTCFRAIDQHRSRHVAGGGPPRDKNGHAAGQTTELREDSGYSGQDSSTFGSCLGTAGVRVVETIQQSRPNAYISALF